MLTTLCLVSPASPFLKVTLPGAAPSLRFEVTEQTTIVRIALAIECVVLDDHVRMAVSRSRARRLPELDPEYVPLRDYQVPSTIPRCLARRATASSSSTSTASEYTSLSWFNNFLASCRLKKLLERQRKTSATRDFQFLGESFGSFEQGLVDRQSCFYGSHTCAPVGTTNSITDDTPQGRKNVVVDRRRNYGLMTSLDLPLVHSI